MRIQKGSCDEDLPPSVTAAEFSPRLVVCVVGVSKPEMT